ncbi:hypothetical protein GTQ34_14480 [Muricauda sp. JGD-17]|uniref:Uncharacterized protein n=1 Tax=Flagellimonas ochracea TaxID=2696472 RepID=A0A964TF04_9FLAO|nr:hypothetical protein [Allomuricauda ochracea]NAY93119.1 hypothetical protein [Allomuricauda ochracea]
MSDFERKLKEIEVPSVDVSKHQQEFRMVLLNTKKTAITGGLLICLPFLFLVGLMFNNYTQIDIKMLTFVYDWIVEHDNRFGDTSILNWIIRMVFLLGPILAIIFNLLGIVHVRYENSKKEIILSIRVKWLNIFIILVCFVLLFLMLSYLTSQTGR